MIRIYLKKMCWLRKFLQSCYNWALFNQLKKKLKSKMDLTTHTNASNAGKWTSNVFFFYCEKVLYTENHTSSHEKLKCYRKKPPSLSNVKPCKSLSIISADSKSQCDNKFTLCQKQTAITWKHRFSHLVEWKQKWQCNKCNRVFEFVFIPKKIKTCSMFRIFDDCAY